MEAQAGDNVCRPETELAAWSAWLRRRKAEGTAVKWTAHLAVFVEWCREVSVDDLTDVTADQIENGFLAWWADRFDRLYGRPAADKTQVGLHNALSSFFGWLDRAERGPARNPMNRVERPVVRRKRIDSLSADELERLLVDGPGRPQQRIVVWLLRWTGLRVGEATALLQRDVDLDAGWIYVRASKTSAGVRDLPIFPELRPELERWLAHLRTRGLLDAHRPFLTTRCGTAMTEQQVSKALKLAAARAGVRLHRDRDRVGVNNHAAVSPHTLRRSFATDLLNRGLDVESVSRLLGHSSVVVTQQAYAELRWTTVAARALAVA